MNKGDLVMWPQGYCEMPGIIIDRMPSKNASTSKSSFGEGFAVLAMLPELNNIPEWFHECELEKINE